MEPILITYPPVFEQGAKIDFRFPNKSLIIRGIIKLETGYYIKLVNYNEDQIFRILDIDQKKMYQILNIKVISFYLEWWNEVPSLDDLKKVCTYIENYNEL